MSKGRVRFDQSCCAQTVQDALANLQDGVPSFRVITRRLGISERTLRRRLKSVGTSYNEILQELRAVAAKNLLRDKMVTVDRVAAQLGYSESANFRHAFKRWTGQSPHSFRSTSRMEKSDLNI
jgi:AraC-like DNA-binding protein